MQSWKMISRALLAAMAGAALIAAPAIAGGSSPSVDEQTAFRISAVDRIFRKAFEETPVGGMTIGIVKNGELAWTGSFGYADQARRIPASRSTVYRIGSITKTFTAIMYRQLVDAGTIKADEPVIRYYEPLARMKGDRDAIMRITFDQLATHRAGFPEEPDRAGFTTGPLADWQDILGEAVGHTTLKYPVGEATHYSNLGYGVLGAALERAADEPFIDYVQTRIIAPMGLRHTSFVPTPTMLTRLARGYDVTTAGGDSGVADAEQITGRGYKIPPGGLFSDVEDLARLALFEMGQGPSGVVSADELPWGRQTSYPWLARPGTFYGAGFFKKNVLGHDIVGHSGGVAGFTSGVFFDPAAKVAVICLRNAVYRTCDSPLIVEAVLILAGADPLAAARAAQAPSTAGKSQ